MLSRRTIIVAGGGLVAARKSGAGAPAASPSSPPAPGTAAAATPVPLGSEEIVFTLNDGTTTHGLFAYPSGGAPPFPGVLLLQSSGAIDRDATVVEPDGTLRRPFVQLADELTKRGMAVFRYDKRGVCPPSHVCDPIRYLNLTKPVLIDDALAAYGRMTANPLIDPKRTAVLGHDEGAWLAPYLPYRFPQIRALVVIGTGLGPMHVLTFSLVTLPLLGLGFYDANADGMLSANEVPITDAAAMARFQERVRGPGQIFLLRYEGEPQRLRPAGLNRLLDTNGDGRLDILTEVRPVYEALLANLASPFSVIDRYVDPSIRSSVEASLTQAMDASLYASYQAEPMDQNLRVLLGMPEQPAILIVNGANDDQTPASSAQLLADGLASAGFPPTVRIYPGLSHWLSPQRDIFAPYGVNMQPEPVRDIGQWLADALRRG
jgi:dienelactone hydrolase